MSSDEESFKTCQMLDLKAEEVKLLDPYRCLDFLYVRPSYNLIKLIGMIQKPLQRSYTM